MELCMCYCVCVCDCKYVCLWITRNTHNVYSSRRPLDAAEFGPRWRRAGAVLAAIWECPRSHWPSSCCSQCASGSGRGCGYCCCCCWSADVRIVVHGLSQVQRRLLCPHSVAPGHTMSASAAFSCSLNFRFAIFTIFTVAVGRNIVSSPRCCTSSSSRSLSRSSRYGK